MARSWPMRSHASSSGMRQSAPITLPPASRISPRIAPVPTPKWIVGTSCGASASKMRRVWGRMNSR